MFPGIIDAVREERDSRETRAEIWKAKLWAIYHVDVQRFTASNRLIFDFRYTFLGSVKVLLCHLK